MNGYERFMAALRREQPDRIPIWELLINEPVIKALHGDITLEDFIEKEDLDGICVFENFKEQKRIDSNTFIDEWGITWVVEPNGVAYPAGHPIKGESDLDKLKAPDPDADYRMDNLKRAVKRFKGEKAIIFLGHEAFEFSHYLRGMDNLLMDYIERPDFVKRLAGVIASYKKRVLERAAD